MLLIVGKGFCFMAYIEYNANPSRLHVGDCVIRSICTAQGKLWKEVYVKLALQGFMMHDMPSANRVWSEYLRNNKYIRRLIPDTCPDCYTVKDFCHDHPKGIFILGTGEHVICVIDGDYYDTWDSGEEIPIYYWYREE